MTDEPKVLFDEQGNQVKDVYTDEDVATKVQERLDEEKDKIVQEAEEKSQENITAKEEEIEKLKTDLETTKEDLTKATDKDKNFGQLRKSKEEGEEKLKDALEKLDKYQIETADKLGKLQEGGINDLKTEEITAIAGDDTELTKKIEHFYDNFSGTPANKAEVKERVKNANILATGGQKTEKGLPTSALSSLGGSNSGANANPTGEKLSQEVKDIAKNFGITEQDLKKNKLL